MLCCLPCACVHYVKSHTHLPSCLTVLSACFTPSPLLFLFLTPKKVQWSHLAALKSSNSAAPSPPPPPVVARSQSFSESGGVASSFAQLHLRSQDPHHHHHHHPSPARTDPQPQPPLHHPQARLEHQASSEEVPPKVRCRGTAAFSPLLLHPAFKSLLHRSLPLIHFYVACCPASSWLCASALLRLVSLVNT